MFIFFIYCRHSSLKIPRNFLEETTAAAGGGGGGEGEP